MRTQTPTTIEPSREYLIPSVPCEYFRYVSTPFSLDVGEVNHIEQIVRLRPPAGALMIGKYNIQILQQVRHPQKG